MLRFFSVLAAIFFAVYGIGVVVFIIGLIKLIMQWAK